MICAQPWIELDFAAFTHNVTQYAQFIGPHRNLAVVVKSNAYGHGLLPIAQWCEQLDLIQWLCVAHLSEAITLRNEGITKPILVLYDLDVDPKLAVLNAIDVMVDTHEMLHFLNELGRGLGQKVHVHLKIDTGMHRLGFSSEEFIAIAPHLARYEGLNIRGIYSHFCEADNVESAYTLEQIQIFERLMTIASSYIPTLVYRHYANTSATLLHSLGSTNLVRVGAGIYGLWPSYELEEKIKTLHPHFSLQPVLSLKARIMRFKHVPEKAPVGYGRSFITQRPTRLAMLSIGYEHGYLRRFSNISKAYIKGSFAPIVGKIAMSVTCIDVTDIPAAQIGDEVTLIGSMSPITARDLSVMIANQSIREIVVSLSNMVERKLVNIPAPSQEKLYNFALEKPLFSV